MCIDLHKGFFITQFCGGFEVYVNVQDGDCTSKSYCWKNVFELEPKDTILFLFSSMQESRINSNPDLFLPL